MDSEVRFWKTTYNFNWTFLYVATLRLFRLSFFYFSLVKMLGWLWFGLCDTLWVVHVLCVSEVLGEAGRGFSDGQSCAGPHTCSALAVTSTCSAQYQIIGICFLSVSLECIRSFHDILFD